MSDIIVIRLIYFESSEGEMGLAGSAIEKEALQLKALRVSPLLSSKKAYLTGGSECSIIQVVSRSQKTQNGFCPQ